MDHSSKFDPIKLLRHMVIIQINAYHNIFDNSVYLCAQQRNAGCSIDYSNDGKPNNRLIAATEAIYMQTIL